MSDILIGLFIGLFIGAVAVPVSIFFIVVRHFSIRRRTPFWKHS
jgi:hypothetical protein